MSRIATKLRALKQLHTKRLLPTFLIYNPVQKVQYTVALADLDNDSSKKLEVRIVKSSSERRSLGRSLGLDESDNWVGQS